MFTTTVFWFILSDFRHRFIATIIATSQPPCNFGSRLLIMGNLIRLNKHQFADLIKFQLKGNEIDKIGVLSWNVHLERK